MAVSVSIILCDDNAIGVKADMIADLRDFALKPDGSPRQRFGRQFYVLRK
jgi:hypothetical protein